MKYAVHLIDTNHRYVDLFRYEFDHFELFKGRIMNAFGEFEIYQDNMHQSNLLLNYSVYYNYNVIVFVQYPHSICL